MSNPRVGSAPRCPPAPMRLSPVHFQRHVEEFGETTQLSFVSAKRGNRNGHGFPWEEHHCHGVVDVRGCDVAMRFDILQSLDKSRFGIVDHCYFDMAPDTPTCKCGRKLVETELAQRRSVLTPMRMTIPPASSLTRMLWPGSSNVFASSAIFGQAALVSGKAIVCSAAMTAPSFSTSKS